jgi:hypothetical protein
VLQGNLLEIKIKKGRMYAFTRVLLQHESSEGRMGMYGVMMLLAPTAAFVLAAHCTAPSRQFISVEPFSEILIRRISEVVSSQKVIVPALHF